MKHNQPEWMKLGEVIELAREKVGLGRSKLLEMLRTDAENPEPVVEVRVFDGCVRRRYGRVSVCRLLQIPES